jgi:hypothetical protein
MTSAIPGAEAAWRARAGFRTALDNTLIQRPKMEDAGASRSDRIFGPAAWRVFYATGFGKQQTCPVSWPLIRCATKTGV